jgi:hypothetical protein
MDTSEGKKLNLKHDGVLCLQNWLSGSLKKDSITASFDEQCPPFRGIDVKTIVNFKFHQKVRRAFFCLNSQFGCDMSRDIWKIHLERKISIISQPF